MDKKLQEYYLLMKKPWGKIFYDIIFEQLNVTGRKKVLDFGSGFGVTANLLAEHHDVTAIEKNKDMVANRNTTNHYKQLLADESILSTYPENYFDLIICHNVLEYVNNPVNICKIFSSILKENGVISIVKHNSVGNILHKAVLLNSPGEALSQLNIEFNISDNFGTINYYSEENLINWFKVHEVDFIKKMGIRSLYGLSNNNSIKFEKKWYEEMKKLELLLAEQDEFINISFYHHLIFKKINC